MSCTVELHADECAVIGALLDHLSAYHDGRRILLLIDETGVRIKTGDQVPTAGLGRTQ